jgi:hypothetical protein
MFSPHHNAGRTGMFPFPAGAKCVYCRTELVKVHGLNRDQNGEIKNPPEAMGWSLFGVAPYCIHCTQQSWKDPDFFRRSGHNEHSSLRWGLGLR